MKKRTLVILLTALLLMTTLTSTAFATDTVTVTLPAFSVTLNGQTNANTYSKYPLLVYRDITYFPMTYYDCRLLGLCADWTAETGLAIEKNDAPLNEYTREVQTTPNAKTQRAEIARGTIRVNGELIDNVRELYPLLLFRNVTYFPLTWRFAVEKFGWNYTFDAKNGLVIENPAAAFETDEQWTGGIDTWGSIMGTDQMRIFATLSNRANERGIVEFDKTSKPHLSLYNITGADMTILTDGTHWEYQVYRVLGKSDELVYRRAFPLCGETIPAQHYAYWDIPASYWQYAAAGTYRVYIVHPEQYTYQKASGEIAYEPVVGDAYAQRLSAEVQVK